MCGRFINLTKVNFFKKKFDINSPISKDLISFNISPSQVSFIIFKKKEIELDFAKWGYSFFDNKTNQQKNVINSRIETIRDKLIFKESYLQRKCILPINGYYEWSLIQNKKIPFFINIPPFEPMYLACIWKYVNINENNDKVFTIITKKANNKLIDIHDRMPVVLSIEESINYLHDDNSLFLQNNFSSIIEPELDFYSVSSFVNSPLNNSKVCIKRA